MTARLILLHALSPLHAGTGQSTGAVDLAIARNRATGVPLLPGSSLKGPLRDRATAAQWASALHCDVFGPATANASDQAGAIAFGDLELLLLPVRSVAGTFAWVTSPWLLERASRDAEAAGAQLRIPAGPGSINDALVTAGTALTVQVQGAPHVVLEDLDLSLKKDDAVTRLSDDLGALLWPASAGTNSGARERRQKVLAHRLVVVHDDVMSFLWRHATQVDARVALNDDSGTVDNLWHEESLPPESVLVGLCVAAPVAKTTTDARSMFAKLAELGTGSIQVGGKASVGRGRARMLVAGGAA